MTRQHGGVIDARLRLVTAAAQMIGREGLAATSIRRVAALASAPLGSVYHYFPQGKQQLVSEALQMASDWVEHSFMRDVFDDPVLGLRQFIEAWRAYLIQSAYESGCPVLAVAIRQPANAEEQSALRMAAAIFDRWALRLTEGVEAAGVPRQEAEELATLILAAVEGSVALCRARQDAQPLEQIGRQLERTLKLAIDDGPPSNKIY